MRKSWLLLIALALVVAIPVGAQEKKDDKPVEKPKKVERPKPEDALRRAMLRAKKVDDEKFVQMTVLAAEDDEPGYIAVVEFGSGDTAIFQGGSESDSDQWIMLTKQQMAAMQLISERQKSR